jgi:hypothetical protein
MKLIVLRRPIEADAAAYLQAAQLTSVAREVTHKASGKIEQSCRTVLKS